MARVVTLRWFDFEDGVSSCLDFVSCFLLPGLFFDHPLGLFLHVVCLILMGF